VRDEWGKEKRDGNTEVTEAGTQGTQKTGQGKEKRDGNTEVTEAGTQRTQRTAQRKENGKGKIGTQDPGTHAVAGEVGLRERSETRNTKFE
jgi:hypothetical protein